MDILEFQDTKKSTTEHFCGTSTKIPTTTTPFYNPYKRPSAIKTGVYNVRAIPPWWYNREASVIYTINDPSNPGSFSRHPKPAPFNAGGDLSFGHLEVIAMSFRVLLRTPPSFFHLSTLPPSEFHLQMKYRYHLLTEPALPVRLDVNSCQWTRGSVLYKCHSCLVPRYQQ